MTFSKYINDAPQGQVIQKYVTDAKPAGGASDPIENIWKKNSGKRNKLKVDILNNWIIIQLSE